jgi:hypothetical protein
MRMCDKRRIRHAAKLGCPLPDALKHAAAGIHEKMENLVLLNVKYRA